MFDRRENIFFIMYSRPFVVHTPYCTPSVNSISGGKPYRLAETPVSQLIHSWVCAKEDRKIREENSICRLHRTLPFPLVSRFLSGMGVRVGEQNPFFSGVKKLFSTQTETFSEDDIVHFLLDLSFTGFSPIRNL
jgi:hypothetical protein